MIGSERVVSGRTAPAAAAILGLAGLAAPSLADVTKGESAAFGVSAQAASPLAEFGVEPTPHASGQAPGPYSESEQSAGISVDTPGFASITTGQMTASASSDVSAQSCDGSAEAKATVDDAEATVVPGILFDPDLLTLSSSRIESSAKVSGDFGAFLTTGGVKFEDLAISVLGADLDIDSEPAPNTVLFDAGGIKIVLNEQVTTGNGMTTRGFEVTAVRITFDDVPTAGGLVNGEIVFGRASAGLTAVEGISGCYANCDENCDLNLFDFFCYTNAFNAGSDYADCDGNGQINVFDYFCFINAFNAGC